MCKRLFLGEAKQHLEAESGGEEGGLEEQHHQVPHRLVVLDGVHALLIHDGVRERWSRVITVLPRWPGAGAWQGSGSGAAAARASPHTPDRRRRRRMGKEGEEYREEWEEEEGVEEE